MSVRAFVRRLTFVESGVVTRAEGAKTVLPSKSIRQDWLSFGSNQKHEKIAKLFKEYFESIARIT